MRFDIFTLFPGMFEKPMSESILGRAVQQGLLQIQTHDIRNWGLGRHKQVDDYPYGGGAGMVFRCEPIFAALETTLGISFGSADAPAPAPDFPILIMSPQGEVFNQQIARELASYPRLALICGHYEGFDERIVRHAATREISIGDYVLTGGELAAMVVVDAVARLLPEVLAEGSPDEESHSRPLLEYPHYTRPANFRGWTVPETLVSGHHAKVEEWRFKESLRRTLQRRLDLLPKLEPTLSETEQKLFQQVKVEEKLVIRESGAEDYQLLADLTNQIDPQSRASSAVFQQLDRQPEANLKSARWVAMLDNELVGYAYYYQYAGTYDPEKATVRIVVRPDCQKQGIGSLLLEHLVKRAKEDGLKLLVAQLQEVKKPALKFVRKRGFNDYGRRLLFTLNPARFDPTPYENLETELAERGIVIKSLTELCETDPDHERKVYELHWTLDAEVPTPEASTKMDFNYYRDEVLHNPNFLYDGCFIAIQDGSNYIGISSFLRDNADNLNVAITGVLPEFRRQKIGLALKVRGIKYAAANNYRRIILTNDPSNVAILALNEKLGAKRQPSIIHLKRLI
jgi:tRNA (guanine37-N1)-methyltransferase